MVNSYKKSNGSREYGGYLEIVDWGNRSLGVMSREEVHNQGLCHRSVLVLVYDSANRLLVQKRQQTKMAYPGCWDLSASGHVLAGESTADAACRELREEVGINPPRIRLVNKIAASRETDFEFVYLFSTGKINTDPSPNNMEVQSVSFLDREGMDSLVREFPENLTPALAFFWKRQLLFPRL